MWRHQWYISFTSTIVENLHQYFTLTSSRSNYNFPTLIKLTRLKDEWRPPFRQKLTDTVFVFYGQFILLHYPNFLNKRNIISWIKLRNFCGAIFMLSPLTISKAFRTPEWYAKSNVSLLILLHYPWFMSGLSIPNDVVNAKLYEATSEHRLKFQL